MRHNNGGGLKPDAQPVESTTDHRSAPSTMQTAHMLALAAILLAVTPGLNTPANAIQAIAFVAALCYVTVALSGLYDLGRDAVREVRAA